MSSHTADAGPDHLTWQVEDASLALVEMTLNAIARHGELSVTRLRVLLAVDRHGPLNLSALAAHLAMSVSAAGRLVARLDEAGLLARVPAPHSRREVSIDTTDAGRRHLRRLRDIRRRHLAAALERMPASARRDLADRLRDLTLAATGPPPAPDTAPPDPPLHVR
ncbi:MAG TPA: MarR family transcriptional regulator [Nonomuraea sp.]|nr:MarR family transcriptional regulator [Nonomuraea sp.]